MYIYIYDIKSLLTAFGTLTAQQLFHGLEPGHTATSKIKQDIRYTTNQVHCLVKFL